MPFSLARAAATVAALLAAVATLATAPTPARAQTAAGAKALVYCPVGVDETGCTKVVTALTGSAAFPGGVDRGYDGTSGTVDLAYATLSQYAVLVIPSLGDDSTHSPYAVLRSAAVQAHLKAGITGRIAVWAGTPDAGDANRDAKDRLLRNLASWGATDWSVAGTTGLVALADLSADAARRYDWLVGVSRLKLAADAEFYGFDVATPQTGTGKEILKSSSTTTPVLAYANMASFGLLLPDGATVGAVAATGMADSSGTSVMRNLLVTAAGAGNTGAATIKTDKGDYAPGETATFTGSGWTAGETVTITLHENPLEHPDSVLSAVADQTGNITNNKKIVEDHDLGVTFYATAKGGTSGLIAQTSFTDSKPNTIAIGAQSPNPLVTSPSVVTTATYQVTVGFNGNSTSCTATLSAAETAAPTWPAGFALQLPVSVSSTGASQIVTLTVKMPAATSPNTYHFTVKATGTGACAGNDVTSAVTDLIVVAAPTTVTVAPVTGTAGGTVSLTAHAGFAAGGNLAGGAISFSLNGTPVGTATTNASGDATLNGVSLAGIAAATYPSGISATLAANGASWATSTGTGALTVTGATTTTVTSSANPSTFGQSVTFTATVSSTAGTPTGTVQFSDNGTNLGAAQTLNAARVATLATSTLTAGTHTIAATYAGTATFATSNGSVTQSVGKATPVITWANPADIAYGTLLSATQLNATASVPGTFDYSPAVGAKLNAGSAQTLGTTFTPTDAAAYNTATKSVAINVTKVNQTITFAALAPKNFGDADFSVSATATSNLAVTFAAGAGSSCTISGTTVHITGAGSCSVVASQLGDGNYNAAPSVTQSFAVTKATPVLAWANPSDINYGTALGAAQLNATASVPGTFAYTPAAGVVLGAGTAQPLSAAFTPTDAANYSGGTVTAAINVLQAAQTITFAAIPDHTFGDAPFALGATVSSPLSVSYAAAGACTVSGGTLTLTGAGSCTVTASQAGNTNYKPATDVARTFAIAKAPTTLTLVVSPSSAPFGSTINLAAKLDPNLDGRTVTFTIGGTTVGTDVTNNGGNASVSVNLATYTALDVAGSPYAVTATVPAATNYTGASDTKSLAITKAQATLAFDPATPLTQTYTGTARVVNVLTTPAGLTIVAVTYAGSATAPTNAGSYALVATLTNPNYQATPLSGTLTVSAKPVVITPDAGQSKFFGASDPSLTFTNNGGLVASDFGATKLGRVAGESVGTYAITIGSLSAGANYALTLATTPVTFEIKPSTVSIALSGLTGQTYNGSPKTVTVTPTPTSPEIVGALQTTYKQGGTVVPSPTNAGSYDVAVTSTSTNYILIGTTAGTLVIDKATPTVAFTSTAPTTLVFNGTYSATATTSGDGALATGASGACSISPANVVTMTSGSGICTVTASAAAGTNYGPASAAPQSITAEKADQVIAWAAPSAIGYGTALSSTQLNASLTSGDGTLTYNPAVGVVLGAGSQTLTVNAAATANYKAASKTVALTVEKATLTVTADDKTRKYNAANPPFTASFGGFQNNETFATSGVAGAPSLSTTATQASNVGTYPITAALGTLTAANYTFGFAPGTLTIEKADQTIAFTEPTAPTYGDAALQLTATAPGGAVSFSATDPCSVSSGGAANMLSTSGAGTCTVTASQGGGDNYNAAPNVSYTLTVKKAMPAVTVTWTGGTYGASNTATASALGVANATLTPLTLSYEGTSVTYGPSASAPTNAGSYKVTATYAGDANYLAASATATTTIAKATSSVAVSCPGSPTTYTGSPLTPCTATVTGAGGLSAAVTPAYTDNTNAGTAHATATFAGDDNHEGNSGAGSFEIGKAASTTAVTAADATYDGAPHGATAAVSGAGGLSQTVVVSYVGRNGTIYASSGSAPTNAGDYTASASFDGDANHTSSTDSRNFSLAKAASTVTVTCAAGPHTYTGDPQTPCTATATGAGGLSAPVNPEYTGNVDAGTAHVTAAFAGDANHTGSTASASFTIAKAVSTTAVTVSSVEYSGTPHGGTAAVTGAGGLSQPLAVSYSGTDVVGASYGPSATAPTNAGAYTAKASFAGDANHEQSEDSKTFNITKAALTITGPLATREYGDANPTLTGSVSGQKNSELFTVTGTTTAVATSPVGDYDVVPSVAGATLANYNVTPVNGKLTVTKAPLTITPANATKTYGDLAVLSGAITGQKNGESFTATYASDGAAATAAVGAGAYPITVLAVDGGTLANYSQIPKTATLTVSKAPLSATVDGKTKVYGDANPVLTGSLTGVKNADALTVSYSTTADATSGVGSYPITAALSGAALANYDVTNPGGSLAVTKRALTVTANSRTKTYGELVTFAGTEFSTQAGGLVNGDVVGSVTLTSNGAPAAAAVATSPYDIIASAAAGTGLANYDVSYAKGSLTVNKAPLTAKAHDESRIYGDPNPAFTGALTGVVNGDAITASYGTSATVTSNVGTYAITPTLDDPDHKLGNYTSTLNVGTLTITQAPLTVTPADASRLYGGANPTFTGTVVGIKNGDPITAAYASTAVAASPAGTYDITTTLADPSGKLPNYLATLNKGTLTVEKAPLTVATNASTKVYGDANPVFTANYSGFVNGETSSALGGTLAFATTATTASDVGPYDVTPSGQTSGNYAITFTKGVLSVTKAPLTIVAANKTKVYGQANPTLTGTITGIKNSDGITASYTTTANGSSDVGSYPIVPVPVDVTPAKLGNYSVTLTNGALAITPATPIVVWATPASVPQGTALSGTQLNATISGVAGGAAPTGGFTYNPAASTPMYAVGSQTLSATFTSTGANYTNATGTVQLSVTNVAPVVTSLVLNAAPVAVGTSVSMTAKFTDPGLNDVHTATIDWEGAASAGTVNEALRTVTGTHTYTSAGVYTVIVTVTDNNGGSGSRSSSVEAIAYIVVYDPSAGFVTGGGWINSPVNACKLSSCAADGSTTGKATFGFNARYQKGANQPDGNTEFQFQAGGLNFKSATYSWLVVAGTKAQYKGAGTINGASGYSFLLTAIDGDSKGNPDAFRMKIWNTASGVIVYDNQPGSLDDSDSATTLGGGSIVIHQ